MSSIQLMAEDALNSLAEYGLSKRQAAVYLSLLQMDTSPVKLIADSAGIPREELYRILKRLRSLGLVKESLSRPRLYTCVQPSNLLNILLKTEKKRIAELESNRQKVLANLNRLRMQKTAEAIGETQPDRQIELIEGLETTRLQLASIIDNSKSSLAVIISPDILTQLVLTDFLPLIKRAVKRGVSVKILTEVNEKYVKAIQSISKICSVKHLDQLTPTLLIIADNAEVAAALSRERAVFNTLDKLIVCKENILFGCTMDLFKEMWKIAVNAELKIEEILTGVAPYLIKAGYGWENISEKYIQMINNAQHQIAIMTSTANGLIRLKKEAMDALAQAKLKRQVAIRVLTQLSKENAKTAIEMANFAEVRTTTPQYAYMHIADRNEAIIGEIAKDTYDNATATGNATWIRSIAVVNTLYRSFEALWKDSRPLDEGITEIENTLKQ